MTQQRNLLVFLAITLLFPLKLAASSATTDTVGDNEDNNSQPKLKINSNTRTKKPNIVFLVCESTDGRTWREGYQNNVIPLPNLRFLEQQPGGYAFHRHYSNTPVCCPSRATFWSGRHAHKIAHVQRQQGKKNADNNNSTEHIIKELPVNGVWNNYEGLPHDFDQRIDQVLQSKTGYTTHMAGKQDFTTGGHTENVKLTAWTMYTRFPYNLHETRGWADEMPDICSNNGTVLPSPSGRPFPSAHGDDWKVVSQTVDWIKQYHRAKKDATASSNSNSTQEDDKPFFVYQGMNIVHPPYRTNEYYYNKIDPSKIEVPEWPDLKDLHPCDLQSSMLKGCIPPLDNITATEWYYSRDRRRNIRRTYYAMIAEFDAMVGAYMDVIRDIGEWENTIFVVTSDHGDMQMEHQQSYKMSPYDASATVPLIIHDGRRSGSTRRRVTSQQEGVIADVPTQLIDLYPTMMELAGVSQSDYPHDMLDGHSLVPLMNEGGGDESLVALATSPEYELSSIDRPDFVVSQFHGSNIAMSWFLIVRHMPCVVEGTPDEMEIATSRQYLNRTIASTNKMCTMKLIVYGTGREVDDQLFDLTNDPNEMINLASRSSYAQVTSSLKESLRSVVDYPRVALDIAKYNLDSMKHWMEVIGEQQWKTAIHSKLRWDDAFDRDVKGSFQALEEWIHSGAQVLPCRSDLVYPGETSERTISFSTAR